MVNVLTKIYQAVLKIFEKALKVENCSKFSIEALLRKSRFLENKTYRFFYSSIFLLPYMVNLEIDISFSLTDLVCKKFMLYRFSLFFGLIVSMEISITLINTSNQTSIFLQKLASFSFRSEHGKVDKTPIENAKYGPEKMYQTTFKWKREILLYLYHLFYLKLHGRILLLVNTASWSGYSGFIY